MTGQHGDVRRAVASGWLPSTGLRIRMCLLVFFCFFFLNLSFSYLFWFVGWPAIGGADPRSHGFRSKHDHSRLLFQPGAVYGAGVPRTHRQSGACEALSSCHPEALSSVDRKAGN